MKSLRIYGKPAAAGIVVLILLAAAVWMIIDLRNDANELEARLEVAEKERDELQIKLESMTNSRDTYRQRVQTTTDELDKLRAEYDSSKYVVDMVLSRYSGMLIPQGMPEEAVSLLERYVRAISTGDMELYLTTMPEQVRNPELIEDEEYRGYFPDYMLGHLEYDYLGAEYTIRAIFNGGPGYAAFLMADEEGNYIMRHGVGITQDYFTNEWVIYDFD